MRDLKVLKNCADLSFSTIPLCEKELFIRDNKVLVKISLDGTNEDINTIFDLYKEKENIKSAVNYWINEQDVKPIVFKDRKFVVKNKENKHIEKKQYDLFCSKYGRKPQQICCFLGYDTEFTKYNDIKSFDDIEEYVDGICKDDDIICYTFAVPLGSKTTLTYYIEIFREKLKVSELIDIVHDGLFNYVIDGTFYFKHDTLNLCITAHANFVDIPKMRDWTHKKYSKYLSTTRNCINSKMPIPVFIGDDNRNVVKKCVIQYRDTLLLNTPQALKKIGKIVDVNKIDIPDEAKSDMLAYKENNYDMFVEYAKRDAVITAIYMLVHHAEDLGGKIPTTIGQVASDYTVDAFKSMFGWKQTQLLEYIKGQYKTQDKEKTSNGKFKYITKEFFETSNLNSHMKSNYYGGENECYVHGFSKGNIYDIDIAGCYPVAMSCIQMVDYTKTTTKYENVHFSDIAKDFTDNNIYVGGAFVNFSIPNDYKSITNLHLKTKNGLIAVNNGKRAFFTWEEIIYAHTVGIDIYIIEGELYQLYNKIPQNRDVAFDWVFNGVEIPKLLRNRPFGCIHKNLIGMRKQYKKGTPNELKYKLLNNSLTGKTGQGHIGHKYRDIVSGNMETITPSSVSSPAYITTATSIARTVITQIMNGITEFIGVKYNTKATVLNATTDGFQLCTDVVLNDEFLDEFEKWLSDNYNINRLFNIFKDTAIALGYNKILEFKHNGSTSLSIKTRVNLLVNDDNPDLSQVATTGYKKSYDELQLDTTALAERLIDKIIKRTGLVDSVRTQLQNPIKIKNGAVDTSTLITSKVSFNYDYKFRPTNVIDYNNYIKFEGERFETIEEQQKFKKEMEHIRFFQITNKKEYELSLLVKELNYYGIRIQENDNIDTLLTRLIYITLKNCSVKINGNTIDLDFINKYLENNNKTPLYDKTSFSKLKKSKTFTTKINDNKSIIEEIFNIYFNLKITIYDL